MPDLRLSVKAIRVNAKLTQEELSKELGITVATYCNKENGTNDWTWEEIKKISSICKIPENFIQ